MLSPASVAAGNLNSIARVVTRQADLRHCTNSKVLGTLVLTTRYAAADWGVHS